MPTYEYKCLDCGRRSEVFQQMTDEPLTTCEVCKGKLKRLIGAGAGLIFKGSGFYCTDYRSNSYQHAASSDSKPAAETSKSSSPDSSSATSSSTPAGSTPAGSSAKEGKKP